MSGKKYTKRILFVGMPDMAIVCLQKLVSKGINIVGAVPPPRHDPTRGLAIATYRHAGLRIVGYDYELNEEEFLEKVRALQPDLGVVASFCKRLPPELLSIPKDGFINLHPSKLPDYRGGNPYSHIIINGEKESAVTLHFMDNTFDTGDIISQYKFAVRPDETMGTLFSRTNMMCASMLYEALDYYENRPFPRKPQKKVTDAKKAYTLSFEKRNVFIDWSKSAEEIERFVRALNPYIGAVTTYKNTIVRINYAYVLKKRHNKVPGTICDTKESLKVACGKDMIEIDSVQYGGYYICSGLEFADREHLQKGEVFNFE